MDSAANSACRFSVVIPTCNRPALLSHCLDRIAPNGQNFRSDSYEVIVTDDGNQQQQVAHLLKANYPWVEWVEGPRRGPAANRNHGASLAKGEWLLFCDDDCLPDANLLDAYARALQSHPDCQVFEGRTMADREKRHPLEESPINDRGGNLWSCNFAIRRSLFEKMGGFDESFPNAAGEDFELRLRLEKAGIPVVFLTDAMVIHPWRRLSIAGYLRQQARHRRSHLLMMTLHPDYRSYFTAWHVAKDVVRYYLKHFSRDLKSFGGSALLFQPLFLWCQLQRVVAYRFGISPCCDK